MTTNLSISQLSELKNGLENKESSSDSDNTSITSDTSWNSKDYTDKNEKFIYIKRKLESRIHYMKLDIVNKDIEIEELKMKLQTDNTNITIFKHINFLFERLDNGVKVLNDKLNSENEIEIFKKLAFLEYTDTLCHKVIDKYDLFLHDIVFPLLIDHPYLKSSIVLLFEIKKKELFSISSKIKNKIIYFQQKQILIYFLIIMSIIMIIFIGFLTFYKFI